MLKKFLISVLIGATALLPFQAQALDLADAFSGLSGGGTVSLNSGGSFSSQARTGVTFGGGELRVPRSGSMPQLISMTPPRIVAGCNGISAHFGGFSFISGEEFGNLLKQIASGAALGFVTSLVMKTLCPACEAVVQELKTAAANAAQNFRNSCQWGQDVGRKFSSEVFGTEVDQQSLCAMTSQDTNASTDGLAAFNGVCSNIGEAVKALRDYNRNPSDSPEVAALKAQQADCSGGARNLTWAKLGSFDLASSEAKDNNENYYRKVLLLNILGVEIGPDAAGEEKAYCEETGGSIIFHPGKDSKTVYCKPPADTKLLTGLFLCGAPNNGKVAGESSSTRVTNYCKKFFEQKDLDTVFPKQLWYCDDRKTCPWVKLGDAKDVIQGEGFLVSINKLLLDAVQRVRTNQGFMDTDGQKILRLIEVAPYPLYQAINAAAVYPSAAGDLIDSLSILTAEQFAYALLDDTLRLKNRSNSAICPLTAAQSSKMLDFMAAFRQEAQARLQNIGSSFVTQQAIAKQIQEINLAIQQQTMSTDLLQTGKMAQSLNSAITPSAGPTP